MIVPEHAVPALLFWLLAAAGVAAAAYSFRRFLPWRRHTVLLTVLRAGFFLLLLWCMLLPQWRDARVHTRRPRFLVCLDASQSMALRPGEGVPSRWDVARASLADDWPTLLGAKCDLDLYAIGESEGARRDMGEAGRIEPVASATHLHAALQKLADRYRGRNVAGMVLLSDGRDTREAFDDWAALPLPWPVYSLRLEAEGVWEVEPDLRVDSVNTPRRVTVGWNTEVKAMVSGQGTRGLPVSAQLLRDGLLIEEQPLQIPAEGGAGQADFKLSHPEVGIFTYRVNVPPLPGESVTNDNAYSVSVQVVDARNRLLYVEGTPRWESKYFTRMLRSNAQVTPLCFIRGPGGEFMTVGARGTMTADMTREQLSFFKIVVVGNLDADELGRQRALNLVEFVDSGGSLVLLGGPRSWGENGFARTPLRKLLPVKSHETEPFEERAPVTLTDAGLSHPAFAGDADLWATIPPVLSVFPNALPAAGAQTLVKAATSAGEHPVIVSQRYGQGKVVAVMTDSLWRWKLSSDARVNKPYQRFWDQLLIWLSPSEQVLAPDRIDLFADREQVFLGEPIEISARLGDTLRERAPHAALACDIVTPSGAAKPFAMVPQDVVTPTGRSFAGHAVSYTADTPGLHKVRASTVVNGREIQSDPLSFFVRPFSPERVPRPANVGALKTLCRSSKGRFFETRDRLNAALAALSVENTREREVLYRNLWQRYWVIACLLALLCLEWSLRKWRNQP